MTPAQKNPATRAALRGCQPAAGRGAGEPGIDSADNDQIAPARGVAIGLAISIIFWVCVCIAVGALNV